MAWTAHGHHIAGTVKGDDRPASVARCGGPGLCKQCSQEAALNGEAKDNLKKAEEMAEEYSKAMESLADEIKGDGGPVKLEHCGLDELHGSHNRDDAPGVYCPGLSLSANQGSSPTFHQELVALINKHSVENGSGTPDWILAEVMMANLKAWELGIHLRNDWRGERNNSIFDIKQDEKVKIVSYDGNLKMRNEIGEAEVTMFPGEISRHGGPVKELIARFPEEEPPREQIPAPTNAFERYQQKGLSDS